MNDFSYDQVPYTSYPFAQTHPDRLATIATLLGMQPTPLPQCRVLELGCGDGTNLYAMAEAFPDSQFVGIDLAASAIAKGQQAVNELGYKNLQLMTADFSAVDESIGQFDYIISHGVYSWIPAAAKDRLLELCRHHLTPQGVAYISYNAYPGFYLRQLPRDMMRLHTRNIGDPIEKVHQGLALLQLILKRWDTPLAAKDDLYGHLILENLHELQEYRHQDGIYHDILADENTPVYFYQFAGHAAKFGLQYLSEADFCETQDFVFPPAVREVLAQFDDEKIILKEQYMDYLKCRIFRQTLLCRQEVKLDRTPKPELLSQFFLAAKKMQHADTVRFEAGVIEEFKVTEKIKLSTDFPLAKAALFTLSNQSPRCFGFDELVALAYQCLPITARENYDEADIATLREILYAAYCADVIQFHIEPLPIAPALTSHPKTTTLARWQAAHGNVLTNLRHASIDVDAPLSLRLIQLLDGTRTPSEIVQQLLLQPATATLQKPDGSTFANAAALAAHLEQCLPEILEDLRTRALLLIAPQ